MEPLDDWMVYLRIKTSRIKISIVIILQCGTYDKNMIFPFDPLGAGVAGLPRRPLQADFLQNIIFTVVIKNPPTYLQNRWILTLDLVAGVGFEPTTFGL